MSDSTVVPLRQPDTIDDLLTAILRNGTRRLLAQAIEAKADAFLATMKGVQLPDGRDSKFASNSDPSQLEVQALGIQFISRPV